RGLVVVLVVLHDRLRCRLRGLLRSRLARDNLSAVVAELHTRSPWRRLQTLGPHPNRDPRLDDDTGLALRLAQGEVQLLTLVHRKDHVTLVGGAVHPHLRLWLAVVLVVRAVLQVSHRDDVLGARLGTGPRDELSVVTLNGKEIGSHY